MISWLNCTNIYRLPCIDFNIKRAYFVKRQHTVIKTSLKDGADTMNELKPLPHQIILSDRQALTITGVTDIDTFDDTAVVLKTSLGMLTVKGMALQVKQVNVETGDLRVDGTIDAIEYAPTPAPKGHWARRLFR